MTAPTAYQTRPKDRVEFRVLISPKILLVQRGRTYEFTCTVYGADARTSIFWIQEEPQRVK